MRIIQSTIILSYFACGVSATNSGTQPAPAPIKVNPNIKGAQVKAGFVPIDDSDERGNKLGLCESDCDVDTDCATGLICADAHKPELLKIGLDDRAANCYNVVKPWNFEVCFNKTILSSGGAGGDPHFRTYDGTKYTYHGECDLVMAHSRLLDNNELDLHARTKIIDDWSLISNAALRIGDDIFEVDNDDSHYFNGVKNVEFPIMLAGKYPVTSVEENTTTMNEKGEDITMKQIVYKIDLVNQGSISITNFNTMLSVRVDSYLHDTYGMLGHRTNDGLIGRDGETHVIDENEMGAQWQVRDYEPMLFHDIGDVQYPEKCILPRTNARSSRHLRSSEVEDAKKACENVDESMRDFCIQDVIRTGSVSTAHIYLGAAW